MIKKNQYKDLQKDRQLKKKKHKSHEKNILSQVNPENSNNY